MQDFFFEFSLIVVSLWLLASWFFNGTMNSGSDNSPAKKRKNQNTNKQQNNSILSRRKAGSNWKNAPASIVNAQPIMAKRRQTSRNSTKCVALDCEMVGIGPSGRENMLARVSIVNEQGEVLLDKYVKPKQAVVDYRTSVSGIRPHDIETGEEFERIQNDVANILRDRILVGHALSKDLEVLLIKHPSKNIRDTAKYRPLAKLVSNGATPSLKRLSKAILGLDIQEGEHDSVEDARATMAIYNRVSAEWERQLKRSTQNHYRTVPRNRNRTQQVSHL